VEGIGQLESEKVMKQLVMWTVASLLFLGLTMTHLSAAEGKAPQTKQGTVKKVDLTAKQVVVMVARELTFTVSDETKIMQGGAAKKLADIKVEDKVRVEYVRDGDTRTAKKIVILDDE
jgi:hypothetical protein